MRDKVTSCCASQSHKFRERDTLAKAEHTESVKSKEQEMEERDREEERGDKR